MRVHFVYCLARLWFFIDVCVLCMRVPVYLPSLLIRLFILFLPVPRLPIRVIMMHVV